MVQWVNRLQKNIFVDTPPLPLLCEISGALQLAQLGLTADRRNASEFRKTNCTPKYFHLTKVHYHYSSTTAFQMRFQVKPIARLFLKV